MSVAGHGDADTADGVRLTKVDAPPRLYSAPRACDRVHITVHGEACWCVYTDGARVAQQRHVVAVRTTYIHNRHTHA